MSQSVPSLLLRVLDPTTNYLHIDDVFFTGILAELAGIPRINMSGLYWHNEIDGLLDRQPCPNQLIAIIEYKTDDRMRDAWQQLRHRFASCQSSYF